MKYIESMKFRPGTKEEILPDFYPDFPYIASIVEPTKFPEKFSPWHWHKEVEIFYLKSGTLEYCTPKEKISFKEGDGGFINSNILHMAQAVENRALQFIHIFDTSLISGHSGSKIEKKYVSPIVSASHIKIIPFFSDNPKHKKILELLRKSFEINSEKIGYEIELCSFLYNIWYEIFINSLNLLEKKTSPDKINDELKMMMSYIYEHFSEKISISDIANYAFVSERKCFRIFKERLHTTPIEFIRNYRIENACYFLINTDKNISDIGYECGLGSNSYFGKIFKEYTNYSPMEYRKKWQNNDKKRQK